MERGGSEQQPDEQNDPRLAIQRGVIGLHKELFGRGPVRSKLYMHEDSVLLLMYEGHTTAEESLLQAGERRTVAQGRVDVSERARTRFIEVVERTTGRKVIGFIAQLEKHREVPGGDSGVLARSLSTFSSDIAQEKTPPSTG